MPRIPTAADVVAVGASASRLPAMRAEAADFGLAAADGLSRFGKGAGDLAGRLSYAERLSDQSGAVPLEDGVPAKQRKLADAGLVGQIAKAKATARERGYALIAEMKRTTLPAGPAVSEVVKRFDRGAEEELAALPAERREQIRAAMAPVRLGVVIRARQRAHNLEVEALTKDTGEALKLLQQQAVREPKMATRYAEEGKALLQSLRHVGALTPEQLAAQSQAFRRNLYAAVLRSRPAVEAAGNLEAGVYDGALDDPALKRLLVTEARWRQESELAQGEAAIDSSLARARRGSEASVRRGTAKRPIPAAGAVADEDSRIDRAHWVRSVLDSLRYAPEMQLRQGVADLALSAEAAGVGGRHELQAEVRIQSEEMLRQRRDDPAAYVMGQAAVADAFAAAELEDVALQDAVVARLAAQEAMELAPDQRSALTRSERALIMVDLQQRAPEGRVVALSELARRYGDLIGQVAADLTEAGLSPQEALLLDPSSEPSTWQKFAQALDSQQQAQNGMTPAAEAIGTAVDQHLR